jgi:1-deoxy-D-xylulose-5-phosphate synthase
MTDLIDQKHQFPLLLDIDSPTDLRKLEESQLPELAKEIREYMLYSLNQCGGHFGASMGVVELTIALHYMYNTPEDKLVWDVGHQAYIHKILTGRRDRLNTIKQPDGLAPFTKRGESIYDNFGAGHSSTSISAVLGMAAAAQIDGNEERRHVAVIGDGGLTGGMALEALNHGGAIDPNMLVILNDNDMSISENVGALNAYFARILAGKFYCHVREGSKKVLSKMPPLSRFAKKTETHIKGMVTPGTFFEELGFNYIGPIDGHNLPKLLSTLKNIKNLKGAKLLHIITTKGKGFEPAEQQRIKYHAVKPGFYDAEKPTSTKKALPTYSNVFGQWLCHEADRDPRLIGITPAMREGSDLIEFSKRYPERYFDVAIAEQHSVTFAAGLACEGKKPVVAIYSTFLQRAYDQLIHDVAIQNLDVTFAIDRAGIVGADGPTHAGSFDLSYLRCIPNMVIMAPTNGSECYQMLHTAYQYNGPAAVRYPRGTIPDATLNTALTTIEIGKGIYCRHGQDIAILAFGSRVHAAVAAGEKLDATVVNMRFIKPLDHELIREVASKHKLIITVEENAIMGGAGSAVCEYLNSAGIMIQVKQLGLPDSFMEHGKPDQMLKDCQLDAEGIFNQLKATKFSALVSSSGGAL